MSGVEPNKHLWDAVNLGIEAEAFLKTPLGKHVRQQAIEDVDDSFDCFLEIDPVDAAAVRAIQFKGLLGRKLVTTFEDLIAAGQQAAQTLHDMDSSD